MHAGVACAQCHASPVFSNAGATCATCHADIHRAQFGGRCEQCHSEKGWTVSLQAIQNHQNRFPLVGAHAVTDCQTCHQGAANSQFSGLATDCLSCHVADFQGAQQPNHQALNFSTSCQTCHSMNGWAGALFDHARVTGFALTGAHSSLNCETCHVGGQFQSTPGNCYGCHSTEYNTTSNPNHVQARFPTDCQTCHSTANWSGANFDHSAFTGFPLAGAHTSIACSTCHTNGRFTGTPDTCVGCHLPDYNRTTNPNHLQTGFPTNCQTCHSTTNWQGAAFDHALTAFPLTGAHVSVACTTCHINGQFSGTPQTCVGCHLPDYNGTTNPNHTAAGFPSTCQNCHTTATWTGAGFNHNTMTSFPLTGAHTNVACTTCHVNGQFAGTAQTCVGCHLPDYNGTTNPNHAAAGFPTDCTTCHSTTTWAGATFNHNQTAFPLNGAHVNVACTTCHVNGQFAGTPQTCVGCHLPDYNGTTNPNHAVAGFPQQCNVCHNTSVWQPATFNHNNTAFPLTGAHVNVACANCHINGNYTTTPTDCYSCHQPEYRGTTDPNHVAAAFPTTCQTCHTTSRWTGATFTHPDFPIYSGTHAGKWSTCADCHVNQSNYATFSCITCHQHSQSNADPDHRGVRNYVYNATSCYSCHPQGRH
jgi:hypothetical protein